MPILWGWFASNQSDVGDEGFDPESQLDSTCDMTHPRAIG